MVATATGLPRQCRNKYRFAESVFRPWQARSDLIVKDGLSWKTMTAVQMARWKCATGIVDALVNRGSPSTDPT
jgi:hypothetical protein